MDHWMIESITSTTSSMVVTGGSGGGTGVAVMGLVPPGRLGHVLIGVAVELGDGGDRDRDVTAGAVQGGGNRARAFLDPAIQRVRPAANGQPYPAGEFGRRQGVVDLHTDDLVEIRWTGDEMGQVR